MKSMKPAKKKITRRKFLHFIQSVLSADFFPAPVYATTRLIFGDVPDLTDDCGITEADFTNEDFAIVGGARLAHKMMKIWHHRDGGICIYHGKDMCRWLVGSPEFFFAGMKSDEDDFSYWLKHTYLFFTLFEAPLGHDDEWEDYYEKLRALMLRSADRFIGTEYDLQAKRVIEAVKHVEITRIL